MNILFTCAGRRTYLLKYFKRELQNDGKIIATDMQMSAPALSVADYVELVPTVYADNYIEILLQICEKYDVNLLLSLNDLELPILAAHRLDFESKGIKLVVSSQKVIDICFDKYLTAQFITQLGLNTPKTYIHYNEVIRDLQEGKLSFPLVLKPRWGSGSIGVEFVDNIEELELVYQLLRKKIQKTILSQASRGDDYILIQEKINGPEYGLDIMNDLQGNHIAVSVKRKLAMRAGETDKAVTVDSADIRSIGSKIGQTLKHIGNLDCDILETNGKYFVLEMNPRFGGGYPFSHEAGVNMPKAIIEWANEKTVDPAILTPTYNKTFAKCDYLVER